MASQQVLDRHGGGEQPYAPNRFAFGLGCHKPHSPVVHALTTCVFGLCSICCTTRLTLWLNTMQGSSNG